MKTLRFLIIILLISGFLVSGCEDGVRDVQPDPAQDDKDAQTLNDDKEKDSPWNHVVID